MEMIQRFITSDGQEFADDTEAWLHEKELLQQELVESYDLSVWYYSEEIKEWVPQPVTTDDYIGDLLYPLGIDTLITVKTERALKLLYQIAEIDGTTPNEEELPHTGAWFRAADDPDWLYVPEELERWDVRFRTAHPSHATASDFLLDEEKMYDFVRLTKDEFLQSYSYLTEAEYDATMRKYSAAMAACAKKIEEENDLLRQRIRNQPDYIKTTMEATDD